MRSSTIVFVGSALSLLLCAGCGAARSPEDAVVVRPPLPSAPTELALPPRGQVQADRLLDGDPVWVVRTAEDQVRVLGARVRSDRDGVEEWIPVSYDPTCACFRGPAPVTWGLDGTIVAATEPDYSLVCQGCAIGIRRSYDGVTAYWMDRYDFERRGETIRIGARWAATMYATPRDPPSAVVRAPPGPRSDARGR